VLSIIVGVAVFAGLLFVAYVMAGKDHTADADPMSAPVRGFLACYLLALAVGLIYLLLALSSVDFPDPLVAQAAAPALSEVQSDKTTPIIKQLDPATLVTSNSTQPELKVYGYNFADGAKLRFNAAEHPSRKVDEHLLVAPIQSSDFSSANPIVVDVQSGDRISQPQRLPILSSSKGTLVLFGTEFPISRELHLLLLVLVAGALGSYVHAIKSLADFLGNRTLTASWFWWYVTRPFLGMALAVIFYAAIRGGFVAGSPADVKSVNPFGVVAVAALVGMFADKASQKLAEIFDTLFTTDDRRMDKLVPLEITTSTLPDATVNMPCSLPLNSRGAGANPLWSAQGLPGGLVIDAHTGTIHGTPTAAQAAAPIAVTLSDAIGKSVTKALTLTVRPAAP
jgi:hypothetical protein